MNLNATGSNDGSDWTNAYTELTDALSSACNNGGDEIWVAKGTYYPTSDDDRCAMFELLENVSIYDGFDGTETLLSEQDYSTNETILSGDIDKDDTLDADNSYHVIYGKDNATIDGFTIKMGYAVISGDQPSDYNSYNGVITVNSGDENDEILRIVTGVKYIAGGGMLNLQAAPTVTNCTFDSNSASKGGAVYNMIQTEYGNFDSNIEAATFTDCIFQNNYATGRGGAINNDMFTSPKFFSCKFLNNECESKGGAVYSDLNCNSTLVNVLFAGNKSERGSALVSDGSSSPTLVWVTIVGNSATDIGAALYQGTYGADSQVGGSESASNDPIILNSLIMENTSSASGSSISSWLDCDIITDEVPASAGTGSEVETIDGTNTLTNYFTDPIDDDAINSNYNPIGVYSTLGWSSSRTSTYATDNWETEVTDSGLSSRTYVAFPYSTSSATGSNTTYYINADKSGTACTSWATACPDLQTALDKVGSGDQIWIADGTYYPTSGTIRTTSFVILEGVLLYGGFNGSETLLSERNVATNVTILSGNIGVSGTDTDNSYHVLMRSAGSTLDGFTIEKGYADGDLYHQRGAGMLLYGDSSTSNTQIINNCIFQDNYAVEGAGIANYNYANPTITNSTFSNNSAVRGGAILARTVSDPDVQTTTFTSNTTTDRGGAVFIDYGANASFSNNCVFTSNTSSGYGGAIYIDDNASQRPETRPSIDSCTFNGNNTDAAYGGAIFAYNTSCFVTITNCTFGTTTANTSDIDGADMGFRYLVDITLSGNIGDPDIYDDGTVTYQ